MPNWSLEFRRAAYRALCLCLLACSSLEQVAIALASSEPAVERSEELRFLQEETVSIAVSHEQPISQAPSDVYVITDEDIRHSGATDLPTVLRRIPGLDVMQTTGAEFNVSVRGDNQLLANKLLVLVDGRSIYEDAQGFVFWKGIPVTLPEIKRIEVLKGPAAAIYGFNAFDGVVNIITKSPEDMRGTTIQFGGGELGTFTTSAVHAGMAGKLGYRLSFGEDQTQQWRNRDGLAFRSYKFNVHTEYALPKASKLLADGGLVDMNRFDGPVQRTLSLSSDVRLPYAYLAYERTDAFLRVWWNQFDATSLTVTHPALAGVLRTTDAVGSPILNFLGNTYNVTGQHGIQLWETNRLTYGLNYRLNTFSGNSIAGAQSENRLGLYVQDEWKATDALRLVAGVRYDLDTFIHHQLSPRAALLYQPLPGHTFRLGLSVAYRPPTLFETHEDLRTATAPTFTPIPIQGSTGLSPEQIVSYELGYQGWYLKHRLRVRADLFFNHISNLIDLQRTTATLITNANSGVGDIYGGEAGVEFLVTDWLSGFSNVAYQEFGQTFTGTARRGGPKYKVNAGLRGEWSNGVSSEATLHYVGAATYPVSEFFSQFANTGLIPAGSVPSQRVDSYTLLNLRGAYRFWQQKAAAGYMREAEAAVSAFNALNDKHKEHPLGDTIGSRVMGWITLKF
ncbi:MAG: TonB-dependent receptor plug domain-containing protein [Nitrospiraceae bacterium]